MDTSRSGTHYGKGEKIMMMLEQKLAQTDLSKYKKSPKERFAEQICLYRKFKTKEAMKRIDCWKEIHSEATAKWYFDESMQYFKDDFYKALNDVAQKWEFRYICPSDDDWFNTLKWFIKEFRNRNF